MFTFHLLEEWKNKFLYIFVEQKTLKYWYWSKQQRRVTAHCSYFHPIKTAVEYGCALPAAGVCCWELPADGCWAAAVSRRQSTERDSAAPDSQAADPTAASRRPPACPQCHRPVPNTRGHSTDIAGWRSANGNYLNVFLLTAYLSPGDKLIRHRYIR